ncbi:MAG TPA: oligosaccharide flippase family protein [Armatimonadota bacterium]|jgi:O-antigen/teichoic acid export membrane protein
MTTTEQSNTPGTPPSLLRQISHYFGGQVAIMAAGFISLPIVTRGLGTEAYGIVNLVGRMLILLTAVSKMGLSHASIRFAGRPKEGEERAEQTLQSSLLIAATVSAFVFCAVLTGSVWLYMSGHVPKHSIADTILSLMLGGRATSPYMVLAGLWALPRTVTSVLAALQRAERRSKEATAYSVVLRYASLICGISSLLVYHTVSAFLIAGIAAETFVTLYYLIGWWRSHHLGVRLFCVPQVRMALSYGLPLIIYEVASVMVAYCDNFIIAHFSGRAAVGLYGAGYGIAEIVPALLAFPVEMVVTPHCFRLWETEGPARTAEFLSRSAARYAIAVFPALALFCVAAPTVVVVISGEAFAGAAKVIPWVLAGLALTSVFCPMVAVGFLVEKRTKAFTSIMVAAVAVNAALNWVLVPRMGYVGGGVSTFITYGLVLLATGIGASRYLRVYWQWASLARAVVLSIGIAVLVAVIPGGHGILMTLARVVAGAVLYARIATPLDPNAKWVVESGHKWLGEHRLPTAWLALVTGHKPAVVAGSV